MTSLNPDNMTDLRRVADFSRYAAVFFDLDGTIYHGTHPLPGAVELTGRFERQGRRFACLTNSNTSPADLEQRLSDMGIEVAQEHIYSATGAAGDFILQRYGDKRRPRIFNLVNPSVYKMLEGRVDWVENESEPCDAVMAGTPTNDLITKDRTRTAMLLLKSGAQLIGICADRLYSSSRGLELGAGSLSHMLAYAANVAPFFTGKPEPIFFQGLCRRLNVQPEQCLLIGDNLEADIAGAKGVGMKAILTLTGITRREDLADIPASQRPDAVVDDLTQLL